MDKRVSVFACANYETENVSAALDGVLAPIGGLDWVKPGMKIAVKVNLIGAHAPEKAATPHPALVRALCERLIARGAEVTLGDSPGGPFTRVYLEPVYRVTGMSGVCDSGAKLNYDFSETDAEIKEARVMHRFCCTGWLLKADAIIDLCKLKTHALMAYTGACKNMFGGVAGMHKTESHYKFPTHEAFADMLVDLCEFFKPRLCLCDAVVAMEGNGPSYGDPRLVGALIASFNPHALDVAAAGLIGLGAADVPTIAAAVVRDLTPATTGELEIFGSLAEFSVVDFKLQPKGDIRSWGLSGKLMSTLMKRLLSSRPQPDSGCVGCGKCAEYCPMKAITISDGRAHIDRSRCICCFCCGEFCPKGAMKAHRPLLARLLSKN